MSSIFSNGITVQITARTFAGKDFQMKIFQEKAIEVFLVYYIAIMPHFHFVLLDHNSSAEFHNKNLAFSVALLKKC